MTDLLLRIAIYVPVLFLITVVYAGQFHDNAPDTVQGALRMMRKSLVYTVVLVVGMQVLQFLFID